MNDIYADKCPCEQELCAFAADPIKEKWADLAQHVLVCDRCCNALADILGDSGETAATPEDDAFIRAFTAEHCRKRGVDAARIGDFVAKYRMAFVRTDGPYALAAAPMGANVPARSVTATHGPDEVVRFVYVSEDSADFWRAELVIPPAVTPETMVGVSVADADRAPVPVGVLRIAGCALPISDGGASLPFSLFLDGLSDTDISFSRAGGSPVPGRLLFF